MRPSPPVSDKIKKGHKNKARSWCRPKVDTFVVKGFVYHFFFRISGSIAKLFEKRQSADVCTDKSENGGVRWLDASGLRFMILLLWFDASWLHFMTLV